MGSVDGVIRTAARRVGLSLDAYQQMIRAGYKWCTACKEWHSRSAFVIDRSRGDGLRARCLPSDRGRRRNTFRAPEKERARSAVFRAVRRGRLPHPSAVPCADCAHVWERGERRHEYDHIAGYDRDHWLTVEAVCTLCHASRESARRAP